MKSLRSLPSQPPAFPDILLISTRLIVRPPNIGDAASWVDARTRNRDYLKPWEPAWPDGKLTPARFEQRLKRQAEEWQAGRALPFLILAPETDAVIGGININNIARGAAQYATLGYWLDERLQGQGLMAEALRLVIEYGFDHLKLHRFNAGCLPHNPRSRALLLKLGFREEGFAEKFLEIDEEWRDHVLFGLPVERWRGD